MKSRPRGVTRTTNDGIFIGLYWGESMDRSAPLFIPFGVGNLP